MNAASLKCRVVVVVVIWTVIGAYMLSGTQADNNEHLAAAAKADEKENAGKFSIKPKAVDTNGGGFSAKRDGTAVAKLKLRGMLPDGPFVNSIGHRVPSPFQSLLQRIEQIGRDPYYKGAIIELEQFSLSMDQLSRLDEMLLLARAQFGKKIVFYAQGYNMMSYQLALSGDHIFLMEHGGLQFDGLAIQEMYFAKLLKKIGIQADFVQVGEYKGASEAMTREGPSKFWNENIDGCLDDLYDLLLTKVKNRRKAFEKLEKDAVENKLGKAMALKDTALIEAGLIDNVVNMQYHSALDGKDALVAIFGNRYELEVNNYSRKVEVEIENPWVMFQNMLSPKSQSFDKPSITVLHIRGPIMSGENSSGGLMGGGMQTGSSTMQRLLKQLKEEKNVKGLILRIDSPGGSALASEVIWQAVQDFSKKTPFYEGKPVYASLGDTAASGGYYIASSAEEIHATSGSLIGSIGVVAGKLSMEKLFDQVGIHVHVRSRGPGSDMFGSHRGFTLEERELFKKSSQVWYDYFKRRVMQGREGRVKDFDAVAKGRIFTGRQCVKNGLVDKRKSLRGTIRQLAGKLNLESKAYDVVHLPTPPNFMDALQEMIGVHSPVKINAELSVSGALLAEMAKRLNLDQDQIERLWSTLNIVHKEKTALMSFVGQVK